jgi:arginyl-tRNA--protein-N-Asp/Glu arginylyltransferase
LSLIVGLSLSGMTAHDQAYRLGLGHDSPQYVIRLDVAKFVASKEQKHVLAKMERFLSDINNTPENFRHHQQQHGRTDANAKDEHERGRESEGESEDEVDETSVTATQPESVEPQLKDNDDALKKALLADIVRKAVRRCVDAGEIPAVSGGDDVEVAISAAASERERKWRGDYSSNVALKLLALYKHSDAAKSEAKATERAKDDDEVPREECVEASGSGGDGDGAGHDRSQVVKKPGKENTKEKKNETRRADAGRANEIAVKLLAHVERVLVEEESAAGVKQLFGDEGVRVVVAGPWINFFAQSTRAQHQQRSAQGTRGSRKAKKQQSEPDAPSHGPPIPHQFEVLPFSQHDTQHSRSTLVDLMTVGWTHCRWKSGRPNTPRSPTCCTASTAGFILTVPQWRADPIYSSSFVLFFSFALVLGRYTMQIHAKEEASEKSYTDFLCSTPLFDDPQGREDEALPPSGGDPLLDSLRSFCRFRFRFPCGGLAHVRIRVRWRWHRLRLVPPVLPSGREAHRRRRARHPSLVRSQTLSDIPFFRAQPSGLTFICVCVVSCRCLTSVYFFYDPDYAFLSLGVYSALKVHTADYVAATSSRASPPAADHPCIGTGDRVGAADQPHHPALQVLLHGYYTGTAPPRCSCVRVMCLTISRAFMNMDHHSVLHLRLPKDELQGIYLGPFPPFYIIII